MELKDFLVRQYRFDAAIHRHMLTAVTADLTEDELNWQAAPGHHSIWHHVWHMFLSNDYYFAGYLARPAVWEAGGWPSRLDLTPMARVFDHPGNAAGGVVPRFVIADVPDELVDHLKAIPLGGYMEYVDEMLAQTAAWLGATPEETLKRKVEWYGLQIPAHVGATSFSHVARHIGMIEDIRGLIRGPGAGTASI